MNDMLMLVIWTTKLASGLEHGTKIWYMGVIAAVCLHVENKGQVLFSISIVNQRYESVTYHA